MKSKVVEYAHGHLGRVRHAEKKDRTWSNIESLINILFSTFVASFVGTRNESKNIEKNDAYYFELGCYFFYHIDVWHIDNKYEVFRDKILNGIIVDRYLLLFQESMKCENLRDVFYNRVGVYFKCYREAFHIDGDDDTKTKYLIGRERYYFEQLALRALNRVPLEVIDFDNMPVLLVGASKTWAIETAHAAITSTMIPVVRNAFQYIYDRLQQNQVD